MEANTTIPPIHDPIPRYTPLSELEYLDPKHLEYYYHIKVDSQKNLRKQGKLPYSKMGSYIRYKKSEINALFESFKVVM